MAQCYAFNSSYMRYVPQKRGFITYRKLQIIAEVREFNGHSARLNMWTIANDHQGILIKRILCHYPGELYIGG